MSDDERYQKYVDWMNSIQPVEYTYEDLKALGFPSYISPEGYITWE